MYRLLMIKINIYFLIVLMFVQEKSVRQSLQKLSNAVKNHIRSCRNEE